MAGAQAYGMVRGRTRAHAGSESAPPPWARREAGVLEGKMHIEDNHWYQIRSVLEVLRAPTIGGQFELFCRMALRGSGLVHAAPSASIFQINN